MTNYEKVKQMSIYEMAEFNVKTFSEYIGTNVYFSYVTSDECIYDNRKKAVEHEIEWLNKEK